MGQRATYDPAAYRPTGYPGGLRETLATEFSERFADGMRNRMLVSFHKYGPVARAAPEKVDAIACLLERVEKYRETGNAEWLVDVANFAMIEFMHPGHAGAHFRPTDSDESPGRVRKDGGERHGSHVIADTSADRLRAKFAKGE